MSKTIKLLADKHLFLLETCLPGGVELTTYDPIHGLPGNLQEYDALFVRTVNPINSSTLPSNPGKLKFIGSATAGIDHIDTDYLEKEQINFQYAAGCNARSVAEYIASALLLWSAHTELEPGALKVGIIGIGHTGGAVADQLERLGFPYLAYDPPKEERDPDFNSCTLDELLNSDILTFHTPLTYTGKHATFHWLDEEILKKHSYELVINAARGGIINEKTLYKSFQRETISHYILDVWENEPVFNDLLANKAFLKTPHIAGYSLQAKWRASSMVSKALADFFRLDAPDPVFPFDLLNEAAPSFSIDGNPAFVEILKTLHPITDFDNKFERLIGLQPEKKSVSFQNLRTQFNLRHEFRHINLSQEILDRYPLLKSLGFTDSI